MCVVAVACVRFLSLEIHWLHCDATMTHALPHTDAHTRSCLDHASNASAPRNLDETSLIPPLSRP